MMSDVNRTLSSRCLHARVSLASIEKRRRRLDSDALGAALSHTLGRAEKNSLEYEGRKHCAREVRALRRPVVGYTTIENERVQLLHVTESFVQAASFPAISGTMKRAG